MITSRVHGLLAQFESAEALVAAATRLRGQGYRRLEAYTPFPVEGLPEAVGSSKDWIPALMLTGGLLGGLLVLALQYYAAVIDYPINVGGRPDASWPAFVPATLEMAILWAVVFGVIGMLVGNGLPRLHHPLFESARFEAASRDGFFLLLRADDPKFDGKDSCAAVAALQPSHLEELPS